MSSVLAVIFNVLNVVYMTGQELLQEVQMLTRKRKHQRVAQL